MYKKSSNFENISHFFVESKKYTFEIKVIREYLQSLNLEEKNVLNLFSGNSKIGNVRVDLDNKNATLNLDVLFYLQNYDEKFDFIILDPPFSKEKFKLYDKNFNENYALWFTKIKRLAAKKLKLNGHILIFGYSSQGMPANWGFENLTLNIFCNGAERPSYFSTLSKKIEDGKEDFKWRKKLKN